MRDTGCGTLHGGYRGHCTLAGGTGDTWRGAPGAAHGGTPGTQHMGWGHRGHSTLEGHRGHSTLVHPYTGTRTAGEFLGTSTLGTPGHRGPGDTGDTALGRGPGTLHAVRGRAPGTRLGHRWGNWGRPGTRHLAHRPASTDTGDTAHWYTHRYTTPGNSGGEYREHGTWPGRPAFVLCPGGARRRAPNGNSAWALWNSCPQLFPPTFSRFAEQLRTIVLQTRCHWARAAGHSGRWAHLLKQLLGRQIPCEIRKWTANIWIPRRAKRPFLWHKKCSLDISCTFGSQIPTNFARQEQS